MSSSPISISHPRQIHSHRIRSRVAPRMVILVATLVFLVLTNGMLKGFDHDENQFVASGALLVRHGLIPYRDYAYFHVPYLSFLYAAIFSCTNHLLLAARFCSIICSIATLLLLAWMTSQMLDGQPQPFRHLVIVTAMLMLLASPVWQTTSGRAWNHDVPTLLTVIAYLLACRPTGPARVFMIGVLIGIAAGTRLTFAPVAFAFFLAYLIPPIGARSRRIDSLLFASGCATALIPCAIIFALAPRAFIFGNLQYPVLNMTYREVQHYTHGLTAAGKFGFICQEILSKPGNLILFLLFFILIILAARKHRGEIESRFDLRLLLLLIVSLFIGALIPTPLFPQYFYTPIIFMMLGIVAAIASLATTDKLRQRCSRALGACLIVAIPGIVINNRHVFWIASWQDWVPNRVHAEGQEVAALAHGGRVLTLAPIFPLEGGAEVYPELATGPFAWRIGPYVNDSLEPLMKIWDADNVAQKLRCQEPDLILLSREPDLDLPLLAYAEQHHISVTTLRNSASELPR